LAAEGFGSAQTKRFCSARLPTLKAFREEGPLEKSGSYETTIGPNVLVPEAGDMIVETALKLLHKLYDEVSAK